MSEVKKGLWQNVFNGSYVHVRGIGDDCILYSEEDCEIIHKMSKRELTDSYEFREGSKPAPVVDDTFNDDTPPQAAPRKHSHYFKDVSGFDEMDTYLLCRVWKIKDDSGALHHALKKMMDAGKRGNKDKLKDITEARDTLNRYLEIEAMFAEEGE